MGFHRLAYAIGLGCTALLGACRIGEYGCSPRSTCPETKGVHVEYAVSPDDARILVGDTVDYFTWNCGDGPYCEVRPRVESDWSITDGAVALLAGGSASTVSQSKAIVVRGMAVSDVRIIVTNVADPRMGRTAHLAVLDSGAVTKVDLTGAISEANPVMMGTQRYIPVQLRTANGGLIRGRPTAWSVSDTTIATLSPAKSSHGMEWRYLIPKKPGAVEVSVSFRDVASVLRLTVTAP